MKKTDDRPARGNPRQELERRPALAQAVRYLHDGIRRTQWLPGDLLPNIRVLAAAAGVSPVIMWQAVNALKQEKPLTVIQGQGTRVIGQRAQAAANPPPSRMEKIQRWQRLAETVREDVRNGVFVPGELLPSLKELSVRYDVCYQTLKKALDILQRQRVLAPAKRTCRVASMVTGRPSAKIVLLGWGDRHMGLQERTPWGAEFIRALEHECARARLSLDCVSYCADGKGLEFVHPDGKRSGRLDEDGSVIGYLLWAQSPGGIYRQVLDFLLSFRKNVAILEEGTRLDFPVPRRNSAFIRLFSQATGSGVGCKMGRFCLDLGHRDIAYLSAFHGSYWSRSRLEGLKEAVANAGTGSVHPLTIDQFGSPFHYRTVMKPFHGTLSELANLRAASHLPMPALMKESFLGLDPRFHALYQESVIRAYMKPLFDRAFALSGVTAWVCANDDEKVRRPLRVPGFELRRHQRV